MSFTDRWETIAAAKFYSVTNSWFTPMFQRYTKVASQKCPQQDIRRERVHVDTPQAHRSAICLRLTGLQAPGEITSGAASINMK
jgi:hypothetical protein